MTDFYVKLLNYSLHALGARALTEHEIFDKLKKKAEKLDCGEDYIPNVIKRLKELALIDDEIYVRNFIKTHSALNPSGKIAIFRKLRLKGIDKDLFDSIWEDVSPDEDELLETAYSAFVRKKGEVNSQKQKERLVRYLAGRGFRGDAIYSKIRSI
ncbi:MAG: regulatory protein RecX [Patescibacteria group bacterium]|nr:recombination regulator RecX [Patescibacteria group bacterium]